MSKNFIFSSESVGEGHPDKVCDTISDAVLDACLAQDPRSRVACETYAKSNLVVVGGEITTKAKLDFSAIARQAIREIGYTHEDDVFHADKVLIMNAITSQSPDIAQGVDAKAAEGKETAEQGAGDQGLMFGYACTETPELMPAPIMYAHQLGRELTRIRKSGGVRWLRPDAKSQVSVQYENDQPVRITNVVVSTQHAYDVKHKEIKDFIIKEVIKKVLPAAPARQKDPVPHQSHRPLRRRRPAGRHRVDRAQDHRGQLRRHGPSRRRRVQRQGPVQGGPQRGLHGPLRRQEHCRRGAGDQRGNPVRLRHRLSRSRFRLRQYFRHRRRQRRSASRRPSVEVFSFKPAAIIRQLNLLRPIYSKTTNYGHFGKVDDLNSITWEKTDKAAALKKAVR